MLLTNRQLPAPYGKPGPNGTSIPLPATVLVARRCPPDKVRPLPPTPSHQSKCYSIMLTIRKVSSIATYTQIFTDTHTPTAVIDFDY